MNASPLVGLVRRDLRQMRGKLALAIASTAIVALADLVRPWPLKVIFDQVLLSKPAGLPMAQLLSALGSPVTAVVVLSGVSVVIALITGSAAYAQVHVTSRLGNEIVCRLRRELFGHLQRLSLAVHHRSQSGELLTRLSSDTQALKDTFTESAITFGGHAITIVGCFAVMFALSWQLSLIVVATLPLLFWNLFRLYRRSRAAAKLQRQKEEMLTTQIAQALTSASLIRAFGRERLETERFHRRTGEHLEHTISQARVEAVSARSVELIGAAATALVVLFGAIEVLGGRMTPGTVLVFSSYLHSLYRPIRQIAKLSTRLSSAMVSARRIDDILLLAPENDDTPGAVDVARLSGNLTFDRVTFSYDGQPLLRDVSFQVSQGQRVALVGASGAGKSTVASLLLRLYDSQHGSIRVDGIDIRTLRRASLRGSIAVVLQDTLILGVTIRENIAYGKPDATDREIEAAARVAQASHFISSLPNGYDTVVGESGATLSGGQRQRLAIARAVIRDASILILDEPLTGLDRRSRARVERAIGRAARGRTCLTITHDLETAASADVVLVLHDGMIVDRGTHQELAARSSVYRSLLQLGTADVAGVCA